MTRIEDHAKVNEKDEILHPTLSKTLKPMWNPFRLKYEYIIQNLWVLWILLLT